MATTPSGRDAFLTLKEAIQGNEAALEEVFAMCESNELGQSPEGHIYNNLTDGVTANATADYTSTPTYFEWQATDLCTIERLIVYIQGSGSLRAEGYGTITAGLTNGIALTVTDENDNVLLEVTPFPVLSNSTWSAYCYDSKDISYGTGDNSVVVRWTFGRSGEPIRMQPGYKIRAYLSDDLTGLTLHTFHIQGVLVPPA